MFKTIEFITENKKFFVKLTEEQELFLCELKQRLLQDNLLDLTDNDVVKIALDYGHEVWKKDESFLSIEILSGQKDGGFGDV